MIVPFWFYVSRLFFWYIDMGNYHMQAHEFSSFLFARGLSMKFIHFTVTKKCLR
jgi:hypothetical protein